jgi:surface protein
MKTINLKLTNNTPLNQEVSIFGVIANPNTANNINNLYQFDLTGQSFVAINSVSITYAPTSTLYYTTATASVTTQNIQGVVDALNTLNIGVFSVLGNIINVASNLFIYQNITVGLPFVSTWNTTNTSVGSSASNQIKLPLTINGTYDFIVDWGDGSIDTITSWNQAETLHTYSSSGTYTITIGGQCEGIRFANTGDRLKILSVSSWGDFELADGNNGHFQGCSNLDLTFVSDVLNIGNCNNLGSMFVGYSFATINNIELWDVSNVVSMNNMFNNCTLFNSDISSWDTSNCDNMSVMFFNATNFNQPIGSWNVSNVLSMSNMFRNAISFNQDISSWDISNVFNFNAFMNGKTDLNYSSSNLDAIYNNWSLLSVVPNLTIDFGTIKYTLAGQAGKDILDLAPNDWTIIDGGI